MVITTRYRSEIVEGKGTEEQGRETNQTKTHHHNLIFILNLFYVFPLVRNWNEYIKYMG